MGRMVHMLAFGIFFSGFLKDMVCLPRPLSPPLYRITMSGSAALEYGFPSSHSTNALSVAVYTIAMLRDAPHQHPYANLALQCLAYFYAVSIVFGRLYCGMHGFLDVIVGSGLGVFLAMAQITFGEAFDFWITQGSTANVLVTILVVLVLVRIHPEPADDCPCFDDSVAFMGVVIGASVGAWHYSRTPFSLDEPIPSTVPFDFAEIGPVKTILRILIGIVFVFVWRAVTKPALFKVLPPIFRVLEQARLNLPRAFFLNASYVFPAPFHPISRCLADPKNSKYKSVPRLLNDDNIIPPASELPHMLANLAHPRKRSISVGPQSAADAYETLAYRNRRRRESMTSQDGNTVPEGSPWPPTSPKSPLSPQREQKENSPLGVNLLPTPLASRVQSYEHMMGSISPPLKASQPGAMGSMTPPDESAVVSPGIQTPAEAEQEKRELFMQLAKPRVRYDVEVVTKLIVYAGIAWIAIEAGPIFFEVVGLGMGVAGR